MKKAQISTEFIIVFSIMLIMFLIILSIMNSRSDEYYYNKRLMNAKEYSEKVASHINTVFLAGPGTSTVLPLPNTLRDETNYTINIYPQVRIVEISWMSKNTERQYTSQILTSNVTGSLVDIIGNINISNVEGGVLIESE